MDRLATHVWILRTYFLCLRKLLLVYVTGGSKTTMSVTLVLHPRPPRRGAAAGAHGSAPHGQLCFVTDVYADIVEFLDGRRH